MRLTLLFFLALGVCSANELFAADEKPSQPKQVEIPSGHEDFFNEMLVLFKKYPDAAKRFGVADKKAGALSSPPQTLRFYACCGDSICTSSQNTCGCTEWCIE